jgi:hypothetical protein
VKKVNGWACRVTPLHPADVRARGLSGLVAVSAVKGSRIISSQVMSMLELSTWDPDAAWAAGTPKPH